MAGAAKKVKTIVAVAATYRTAKFFSRMNKAVSVLGINMIVYTLQYSAYRYCKKCGINVMISKKRHMNCDDKLPDDIIMRSRDCMTGKATPSGCCWWYKAVVRDLQGVLSGCSEVAFFIWNGSGIEGLAATHVAQKRNIPCLYIEIANLPGKIFVDSRGVNAASSLCVSKSVLYNFCESQQEYDEWKKDYLLKKLSENHVPQAKAKCSDISWKSFWDVAGYLFVTHLGFSSHYIYRRLLNLLKNLTTRFDYDDYDFEKNKDGYIFFPMQVSYDSQIVLYSDISLRDAINYASDYSEKSAKALVIKPHPQESDAWVLDRLGELRNKGNVYIVNENVFKIIPYASEVITINSTIGLETLILEKPLQVLGKAFYKGFTQDDLSRYIIRYLIDADFFGEEELSIETVQAIINRL